MFPRWLSTAIFILFLIHSGYGNSDTITGFHISVDDTCTANFSFEQNLCDPQSFAFKMDLPFYDDFTWDFGDGTATDNSRNPVHNYNANGDYIVQLIAKGGACLDTIKKKIIIVYEERNIISGEDTTICKGSPITLRVDSALTYCWGPQSAVPDNGLPSITVTPQQTTKYTLYSQKIGANIVSNGGFEKGNSAFTSEYFYTTPNTGPGQYYVGNRPHEWNNLFCASCGDHTTGGSNLLMIHGSNESGKKIWCQAMRLETNRQYSLSFWFFANAASSLPAFTIYVNDKNAGEFKLNGGESGVWRRYLFTWFSESAGDVNICIVNTASTNQVGNVYGIDDMIIAPVTMLKDSVTVTVQDNSGQISALGDTSICSGSVAPLSASGAQQYHWYPPDGLSAADVPDPVASPNATTKYFVTGTNNGTCVNTDSVFVQVLSVPHIGIEKDTTICKGSSINLFSSGGIKYEWTPSDFLSNPAIPDPVAKPDHSIEYTVIITGDNGCTTQDKISINVANTGALYTPNAFTPNGDGLNDRFRIIYQGTILDYELSIFNRWGQRVFTSKNQSAYWDGTYNGKPQSPGLFAYYLKGKSPCGDISQRGLITLIK